MRQRRQLPPHFSVQERAHAMAISYKASACMREVNYITVPDLTRAIRDLMVGKRPAALITTFVEGIFFVQLHTFNEVRLV